MARAWVNFNGTGAVSIRASVNVSSIGDNGLGDYTVNFSTAMSDANFSAAGVVSDGTNAFFVKPITYASGSFRWIAGNVTTNFDPNIATIVIFR
jgi:hypothetical protein